MNVQPPMSPRPIRASRPLLPGEIALVGTIHMDRESFRALRDLLVTLSPTVIATEMSGWGIRFRQNKGRQIRAAIRRYLRRSGIRWERAGELAATMVLLGFPFEYLAALQAGRRLGASIVNLGRDRDSLAWLGRLERAEWDETQMTAMAAASRDLKSELIAASRKAVAQNHRAIHPGPRDRIYARRIGEMIDEAGSLAAVLGWEHVAPRVSGNTAWFLRQRVSHSWLVTGGDVRQLG
jgi:hypothetical protein